MKVRTRIAPSPTGMPHIATVFQGLIDFVYAKKYDGQFIVRIEDTDQGRFVEGAEDAIYHALEWFDIPPDESPKHGGDLGPYRQSERLDIYKKYAEQLIKQGDAYYCFCSRERLDEVRKQMQSDGKSPMYDKHCRDLDPIDAAKKSQADNHVIRMKIPLNTKIIVKDEVRGEVVFEVVL